MLKTKMAGNPITVEGEQIEVGRVAPDFEALTPDLSPFHLKDLKDHAILISVVPSLDTGVCAEQTKNFEKEATSLGDDVAIVTISADLPFAQARFKEEAGLEKMHLISDHRDLDFGKQYGFVMSELRLLNRGIVVINQDGRVTYVEYVEENTNHPDYDRALEAVRELI